MDIRITIEDIGDSCVYTTTIVRDGPELETQGYSEHLATVVSRAVLRHIEHYSWINNFLVELLIQLNEWAECEGYSIGDRWSSLADALIAEEEAVERIHAKAEK